MIYWWYYINFERKNILSSESKKVNGNKDSLQKLKTFFECFCIIFCNIKSFSKEGIIFKILLKTKT